MDNVSVVTSVHGDGVGCGATTIGSQRGQEDSPGSHFAVWLSGELTLWRRIGIRLNHHRVPRQVVLRTCWLCLNILYTTCSMRVCSLSHRSIPLGSLHIAFNLTCPYGRVSTVGTYQDNPSALCRGRRPWRNCTNVPVSGKPQVYKTTSE